MSKVLCISATSIFYYNKTPTNITYCTRWKLPHSGCKFNSCSKSQSISYQILFKRKKSRMYHQYFIRIWFDCRTNCAFICSIKTCSKFNTFLLLCLFVYLAFCCRLLDSLKVMEIFYDLQIFGSM